MTEIHEQTIDQLDFEFASPCEMIRGVVVTSGIGVTRPGVKCGEAAEWRCARTDCGCDRPSVVLACDACLNERMSSPILICPWCLMEWIPPYTAYTSITRL